MVRLQYRLFLVLTYWQDFLAVLQRPADFLRHLTLFLGILYLKYRFLIKCLIKNYCLREESKRNRRFLLFVLLALVLPSSLLNIPELALLGKISRFL
jgi:hypothetical protein